MMHVRFSQITAGPRVLAGCISYIERGVRPVLESLHGSLGLSLLALRMTLWTQAAMPAMSCLRPWQQASAVVWPRSPRM